MMRNNNNDNGKNYVGCNATTIVDDDNDDKNNNDDDIPVVAVGTTTHRSTGSCDIAASRISNNSSNNSSSSISSSISMGPEPLLISRKQMDALYHLLQVVTVALDQCYYYYTTDDDDVDNDDVDDSIDHDDNTSDTVNDDNNKNNQQQEQEQQQPPQRTQKRRRPIRYTITAGGTLLGAIRQRSILFTDDDIDIAIIEENNTYCNTTTSSSSSSMSMSCLECVRQQLPMLLETVGRRISATNTANRNPTASSSSSSSSDNTETTSTTSKSLLYQYTANAWEGSDRIRYRPCSNVFIDVFCIRKYQTRSELYTILSAVKRNGTCQSNQYVNTIVRRIEHAVQSPTTTTTTFDHPIVRGSAASTVVAVNDETNKDYNNSNNDDDDDDDDSMFPFYHFDRRKAIELWPKEVYREYELFPLQTTYTMGPMIANLCGPNLPLTLLHRSFGADWSTTYYVPTNSHHTNPNKNHTNITATVTRGTTCTIPPPQQSLPNISNNNNNQQLPLDDNNNNNITTTLLTTDCSDTTVSPPTNIEGTRPPQHQRTTDTLSSSVQQQQQQQQQQQLPPHAPKEKGGQWEGTVGHSLLEEHYIPIQPTLRHLRRHDNHFNRTQLMEYIQQQSIVEQSIINTIKSLKQEQRRRSRKQRLHGVSCIIKSLAVSEQQPKPSNDVDQRPPRRTIYMDGVFDLFHVGHVHAIEQCAQLGDRVLIGVVSDVDATSYKRTPIISESDRIAVIRSMAHVHQVICPCPLIVTLDFLQKYSIDVVVHGFANIHDMERQKEFFAIPQQLNMFQQIDYYSKLSTTDIIHTILQRQQASEQTSSDRSKSQQSSHGTHSGKEVTTIGDKHNVSNWFGTLLANATNSSCTIPYDPFPIQLRTIIDPHIQTARRKQNTEIERLCQSSNCTKNDLLQLVYTSSPLSTEGVFDIDIDRYPLRETLLHCGGFPTNFDLTKLHEQPSSNNKDTLLHSLTRNFVPFQQVYDEFVRNVCIPRMSNQNVTTRHPATAAATTTTYYYQAFPCIRIVQPNEFSIGPHADITYGHHIGCINIYVPLTCIDGTAALFLESRYGSEDWHPIVGKYGTVKHFPGATCLHWTTNNTSNYTRVSLDFRIVDGTIYDELSNSGETYRAGFYNRCRFRHETGAWERINSELLSPDKRTGFPWTVKDWDVFRKKKQEDKG